LGGAQGVAAEVAVVLLRRELLFFDDWAALAEEAEIEEILLREAIQLSLQGRPASQNSGRVEVPQSPPSRSPGPGTSGAGGGAGSSANMVSNNSRIGGAAS